MKEYDGLKVLGGGKLEKSLTVQAHKFSKTAEELSTKLNDIYYELSDIADTLRFNDGESEYTRNDLELIEERLDLLYRLSAKYGETEEEMLSFLENAKAELDGTYVKDFSKALLLGSYFDESLTGTAESQQSFLIKNENGIFKKNGGKYAEFVQADETVTLVEAQPLMMHYLSGEHQVIMTGEIEGVPFKIKMDSYSYQGVFRGSTCSN